MSEAPIEATAETETTEPNGSAETDWQAMARKHEKAAKDLRAQLRQAEPQLREYEQWKQASQTEAERQNAALLDAQSRLAKAERDAMRASVALSKGLPANLAARLQGDDQAALEADADELLALIPADTSPRAPRPDRSQGLSANGAAGGSDRAAFTALIKSV